MFTRSHALRGNAYFLLVPQIIIRNLKTHFFIYVRTFNILEQSKRVAVFSATSGQVSIPRSCLRRGGKMHGCIKGNIIPRLHRIIGNNIIDGSILVLARIDCVIPIRIVP